MGVDQRVFYRVFPHCKLVWKYSGKIFKYSGKESGKYEFPEFLLVFNCFVKQKSGN